MKKSAIEAELLALRKEIGDLRQALGEALEAAHSARSEAILLRHSVESTWRDRMKAADQIGMRALDLLGERHQPMPESGRIEKAAAPANGQPASPALPPPTDPQ